MQSLLDNTQRLIQNPDYIIDVKMPLFSKARPRLTKTGRAYMPESYRIAQSEMRRQIVAQWHDEPLIGPIGLYVRMRGEAKVDPDNAVGALLDAVGPSKDRPGIVWVDDRVSVIPLMIVEWERAKKDESSWHIRIIKL